MTTKQQKMTKKSLLPSRFDTTKLETIGLFSLPLQQRYTGGYSRYTTLTVLLLQYGRHMVYLPNMTVQQLHDIHPDLVPLCAESIGRKLWKGDWSKTFSELYYHYHRALVPKREITAKTKYYNLLTYRHRLKEDGYHIVYSTVVTDEYETTMEHVYQKNTFHATHIESFDNYRYVTFQKGKETYTIDMQNHSRHSIAGIDHILTVTDKYVVGLNRRHHREVAFTRLRVLDKESGQTVYRQPREKEDDWVSYCLIADRYLLVDSAHEGAVDLETGKTIPYPFGNTYENFVAHVTKDGFWDETGYHPIDEFPDIKWTGYDAIRFVKRFGGFIPRRYEIGKRGLDGTGWYERDHFDVWQFTGIQKGIFYQEKDGVVNVANGDRIPVDEKMWKWIKRNEYVTVLDHKPNRPNEISVWDALQDGKIIGGLKLRRGVLTKDGSDKTLRTQFLKKDVVFRTTNIQDVWCTIQGEKHIFLIQCQQEGKVVTFETRAPFEQFEVADIAFSEA